MQEVMDDMALQVRRERVRRVKKVLRHLPRRTNIHKYPILKWFSASARRSSYIWSFRRENVIPAFYLGWIIALIPMYGLQMAVAFIFSLLFRANCLVAMALQWITNPLSIPFIIVFQYKLGDYIIVNMFGASQSVGALLLEKLKSSTFETVLGNLWETISDTSVILHLVAATLLGGFIIAIVGAVISHVGYIWYLRRYDKEKK